MRAIRLYVSAIPEISRIFWIEWIRSSSDFNMPHDMYTDGFDEFVRLRFLVLVFDNNLEPTGF